MLCCIGLFAGFVTGQYLGGAWMIAAPIIGFVLGLVGDMKFIYARKH